jgi:hypothetical protein
MNFSWDFCKHVVAMIGGNSAVADSASTSKVEDAQIYLA